MSKISKEKMERTEGWHKKAFALLQGQKIETILWKQWDEDNTTGFNYRLYSSQMVETI